MWTKNLVFRLHIIYQMVFSDPQNEAARIQADWSQGLNEPSEAEMKRAALLAWEGHVTSVKMMKIWEISITDIPQDYMKKLASIVTTGVIVYNMTHADQMGGILACLKLKCPELVLYKMALSRTEIDPGPGHRHEEPGAEGGAWR